MNQDTILITHGGGGSLTRELINDVVVPIFDNPALNGLEDSSLIPHTGEQMVLTTDSHVVHPLFFPGGDIGKLSVCGTVNDLATAGALPVALSVGLIIEEGFSINSLKQILVSMKRTADEVHVPLVTGDTKVVEKSKGDGLYINTAGVGLLSNGIHLTPQQIEPGDVIMINGPIGNHEAAIICARNDIFTDVTITSDCAPLSNLMQGVIDAVPEAKCARDPTRGGVASTLIELIESSGYGMTIQEKDIQVETPVQSVCDILGMDPLLMANEGKMLIIVPESKAERCIQAMKENTYGVQSKVIGYVHDGRPRLTLETVYGTKRIITMPAGSQLPRIC